MDLNRMLLHRHLEDEEEVQHIAHKHWFIGLRYLMWPTLTFAGAWLFFYLAPFRTIFWISSVVSLGSVVYFLRNFFDYYLDAWIITDMGIIDVEWHGWFHRQSSRILYSDIQGVSYEIAGFAGTVFRYGDITVEKISSGTEITLEYVPRPKLVESAILENMEGYLHTKNLKDAKHVQEVLASIVAREMQLDEFDDEEEEYDEEEDYDEVEV